MNTLMQKAVQSALNCADAGNTIAADVRALFAGVPPAKRDEVKDEYYKAIRLEARRLSDGTMPKGAEAPTVAELKEKFPRINAAYDAARQAVRRLFKSGKKKKKSASRATTAIRSKGECAPSIAYWQKQESGADIPRIIAALQVLKDLLPAKAPAAKKKKA